MMQGARVMAIPDFQSLMLPVLSSAARGETSISACIRSLADELGLSGEERAQLLPSGKQPVFANRVHWAKFHLGKAGLVEATRRGHFKITPRGMALLDEGPDLINIRLLGRFPEFRAFREHVAPSDVLEGTVDPSAEPDPATATPEEGIEAASEELEAALRADLLERVVAATPQFFEALVVDLMIAMGYGGSRRDAGTRLGRSGDGGLDGLINEDVLGLDSIYLQAKRYSPGNVVGVEKVREFAGALVERGASKGVFVTTSHFASGAKSLAERIPQRLVLIDGEQLSRLLVRHGVGVRAVRTVELKRLDPDYFIEDESP
jgi:restriction system protein